MSHDFGRTRTDSIAMTMNLAVTDKEYDLIVSGLTCLYEEHYLGQNEGERRDCLVALMKRLEIFDYD